MVNQHGGTVDVTRFRCTTAEPEKEEKQKEKNKIEKTFKKGRSKKNRRR